MCVIIVSNRVCQFVLYLQSLLRLQTVQKQHPKNNLAKSRKHVQKNVHKFIYKPTYPLIRVCFATDPLIIPCETSKQGSHGRVAQQSAVPEIQNDEKKMNK